jgi:osmotically-inducible protein OsmY
MGNWEHRGSSQLPYAGTGEPRWGESTQPSFHGDSARAWDRSRHASSYGEQGRVGNYGSAREQEWNRSRSNDDSGLHARNAGGFFGRGPKGYTRSDDRIREDVCDRLSYDDEVDASDITVTVSNGEVTLEGSVPDRHSKHRAEDIADAVNGVKDVHNRLKARKTFFQEVGDRLMGREEEPDQGHSGSGTRNAPASSSSATTGRAASSLGSSSTGSSGITSGVPNGR